MPMLSPNEKNAQFIREYIPKVSRTFALTIKFLPKALRDSVNMSYLLCRVADTLEDSPYIDTNEKYARLNSLKDLLIGAENGRLLKQSEIASLCESINPEHGYDHKLLFELARLFEILESLPVSHKPIIYHWVAEMAGGMAKFSKLENHNASEIATLKNIEAWDEYCYYVAGTVGNMLTGLFAEHYHFNNIIMDDLLRLGESFGLGLQKVNVIKDVPADRERGVCYLPENVLSKYQLSSSSIAYGRNRNSIENLVGELLKLTITHFDDALDYFKYFPRHLKGVRMFLIIPIYLAVETLSLIKSNPIRTLTGPPVKLTRRNVSRLVGAASLRIGSNNAIYDYYQKLRMKIVS